LSIGYEQGIGFILDELATHYGSFMAAIRITPENSGETSLGSKATGKITGEGE
jgi:hypothetical protein